MSTGPGEKSREPKKAPRLLKKQFGEVLVSLLVIGMSLSLWWIFSLIWRYGEYLAKEPSILILSLETAMLVVILAFGLYRRVALLRRLPA